MAAPNDDTPAPDAPEKPKVVVEPKNLNLHELQPMPIGSLADVAKHFGIENYGTLKRQEIIFQIVQRNLAAGGKGVAQALSARDQAIAADLGPQLAARGLLLVGLDVIGDCLTEVNVTSPTCFREIMDQTGFDVAAMFIDALEQALA